MVNAGTGDGLLPGPPSHSLQYGFILNDSVMTVLTHCGLEWDSHLGIWTVMAQVMACCLLADQCLSQCYIIINMVHLHSKCFDCATLTLEVKKLISNHSKSV